MTAQLILPNVTAQPNDAISVPLTITSDVNLGSTSLAIGFDKNVLSFVGIVQQPTTNFFYNPPSQANNGGEVRISWFDMAGIPAGTANFCTLQFTYKGGTSPLTFNNKQVLSAVTDEMGNNIPVEYTDGNVGLGEEPAPAKALTDTMMNIAPITQGVAGDLVNVPVFISDISTFNVCAYEFAFKCDTAQASLESIDSAGTLTEGWMNAFNNHVAPYSLSKAIAVAANAYPAKTGSVLLNLKVRLKVNAAEYPVLVMPIYFMLNETLIFGAKPTV